MNLLKTVIVAILICFCFSINFSNANSIAFSKEQLAMIKTKNMGKQWLMLLWSVDCPPCFKELAIIQKLQNQYDGLAVVIINSDANNEINEEREDIIDRFELGSFTNFHFVDGKGDQSRFFIDPNWYGELPRSYFIENNGKFHGKSGLVNESTLIEWLTP